MQRSIILFALGLSLSFIGCQQKKNTKSDLPLEDSVIKATKELAKVDSLNSLQGSWVEPNPINNKEVQGFTLYADSSARSINMHTLLYQKWWFENNKLYFIAKSIGNKGSSTDTLDYVIVKLDTTELRLQNGTVVMTFKKQ